MAPLELRTVPPRRKLGPERLPDPNEVDPPHVRGEADVIGGDARPRAPIEALALFDRFPSLVEGRQVPAATVRAHCPEPASRAVERQPRTNRKVLDDVVAAELSVAEEARAEH